VQYQTHWDGRGGRGYRRHTDGRRYSMVVIDKAYRPVPTDDQLLSNAVKDGL
jgi:hypothetical protein